MAKKKLHKEDKTEYIPQRSKFKGDIEIKEFPWTANQQKAIDTILHKDSKIVFINAPAGSGKSLISTYCGLKLLGSKTLSDYLFIRSPLECSDSAGLGFIPGTVSDKFSPYSEVLEEKLSELVSSSSIQALKNDNRLHAMPTNYIRGQDWKVKYCHIEEAQNLTLGELTLILTRYGQRSKLVIVADPNQSDLPAKKQNGFIHIFNKFNDEESRAKGIHCVTLDKSDIKRSDITAFIIDKLDEIKNPKTRVENMFVPV